MVGETDKGSNEVIGLHWYLQCIRGAKSILLLVALTDVSCIVLADA